MPSRAKAGIAAAFMNASKAARCSADANVYCGRQVLPADGRLGAHGPQGTQGEQARRRAGDVQERASLHGHWMCMVT
jgi:hypothetical protein